MTNKTLVERLLYTVIALVILAVLAFLAVTPEIYLESKPVYGVF